MHRYETRLWFWITWVAAFACMFGVAGDGAPIVAAVFFIVALVGVVMIGQIFDQIKADTELLAHSARHAGDLSISYFIGDDHARKTLEKAKTLLRLEEKGVVKELEPWVFTLVNSYKIADLPPDLKYEWQINERIVVNWGNDGQI